MASVPSPWYDTVGAGRYTKHAPETLERLRCTGGGSIFYKIGKKILYHKDDLDAWIRAGRRASTSGPLLSGPRERDRDRVSARAPRHRET